MTRARERLRSQSNLAMAAVLLVSIGIAVFAWRTWVVAEQQAWATAEAEADAVAQRLRAEVGRLLNNAATSVTAAIELTKALDRISLSDPEARATLLRAIALRGAAHGATAVLDAEGNIIVDTRPGRQGSQSRAGMEYFEVHRSAASVGRHLSAPYRAPSDGRWIAMLSQPVIAADGTFSGVVATVIELDHLQELFARTRIGQHGTVVLMRHDGVLVVRAPFNVDLVGRSVASTPFFAGWRDGGGMPFTARTTVDGENRRYVVAEFSGVPLVLAVSIAEVDVLAALGPVPSRLVLGAVSLGCVLLLAVWLFRLELSARAAALAKAAEGAAVLELIADESPDMIAIVGTDRVRRFVSQGSRHVFGLTSDALLGEQAANLALSEDAPIVSALFERLARGDVDRDSARYRARHADGRIIWVETVCNVISGSRRGREFGLVAITRDVTLEMVREETLVHSAERDALTGLVNRRALQTALARIMAEQQPVAVIAIDLDHFKEINDAEGHAAGDAVLYTAAARLREVVRETDVVARLGGDEFMVLLVGLEDDRRLAEIADRISDLLHQSVSWQGKQLRSGATLGIACVPTDANTPEAATAMADEALIRAKRERRGSIGWADNSEAARLSRTAAIVRAVDQALSDPGTEIPGLAIALQPILKFDAAGDLTNSIMALEALMRWRHPQFGLVPPDELLAAIGPDHAFKLGREARRLALTAFHGLKVRGLPVGRLALNLSAAEVLRPEIVVLIEEQTREAGLALSDIEIEINEDVLLERVSDRALEQLAGLRERGARLSLDDFGTGNSGLSQLLRLQLDAVKIDRRFVERLGKDKRAIEIVKATVALTRGLDLDLIAEGVETTEQADILHELGCGAVQGYLMARPMLPDEVAEWLLVRAASD